MYQDDMVDEDDGCGGFKRRQRTHPQIKHIQPRVRKESYKVDDYLRRSSDRRPMEELNFHEFDEKKVEERNELLAAAARAKEIEKIRLQRHQEEKEKAAATAAAAPPPPRRRRQGNSTVVPIGKAIPWRKNSSRTIARGGAPSYYGVYIHEVHIDQTNGTIQVRLMALGEWNLPSPKRSLFLVTAEGETWDQLAEEERELAKEHKYYPSRFDQAQWLPSKENNTKQGYFEGTLSLPWSFLEASLKQKVSKATLSMRYAASAPWHDEYAVINLLEFDATSGRMTYQCPRNKHPVPVEEAWRAIFPADVFERFRSRELKH